MLPYAGFDNAASTPPFTAVLEAVNRFAGWYGNVHRGTGFKSRLSSWAFDDARATIAKFIGASPSDDVVLFTRNTTEALNHLAERQRRRGPSIIVTTAMEHHSNDLPWRAAGRVVHAPVRSDGTVDEDVLRELLRRYAGEVSLLAISGASNVTGVINPIHRWARWAHEAGAKIVVDAAQLVAHRPIDMRPHNDVEHLDFVAFSAHKMYAPFGVGVLAGSRAAFEDGSPSEVGGGTVEIVGLERVAWASLPDREEAGTPCILGAIALAEAIRVYHALGWELIIARELMLMDRALDRLARVPGITMYGPSHRTDRLGVIAFNLGQLPHALVSAILSQEWAIGTRSGCFCAHPYVKSLLGIDEAAATALERAILAGDRSAMPGAVRVSIGLSNALEEIDRLGDALEAIAAGRYRNEYRLDPEHGDYISGSDDTSYADYVNS